MAEIIWDAWASKVPCDHPDDYDCNGDDHRRWTVADRSSGLVLHEQDCSAGSHEFATRIKFIVDACNAAEQMDADPMTMGEMRPHD